MNTESGWLLAGLPLIAMLCVLYWLRLRWVARQKRRIPRHWPLHARELVNSEELRVWRWLSETFDDHDVMIKISVTRFIRPHASETGLYWYGLLKNITCTFSVCAEDGHVVGCVDVPKSFGLSQKARTLKENLLAHCGIAYIVLNPCRLPNPEEIRNEFLGEVAERSRQSKREEAAAVAAARASLQKTLVQQRRMRKPSDFPEYGESATSSMPSHWNDSFFIQSNSRPAELQ
ncbi:MAG TPA: DUF2726 domain-containing protein [Polaromonas sp.]